MEVQEVCLGGWEDWNEFPLPPLPTGRGGKESPNHLNLWDQSQDKCLSVNFQKESES